MKIIRFEKEGKVCFGELQGDTVLVKKGTLETGLVDTEEKLEVSQVKLLAPCTPSKAVCVGLNYMDHIQETNSKIPESPVIFIKPSTSVAGPEDEILYPSLSKRVDYEGELAIVIGKKATDVPQEEAKDYILGYTCANDVTARDLQPSDGQWSIAKGFDTFLPLGPWICTDVSSEHLSIRTELNGKTVQDSNTKYLLFKPEMLVSYLSSIMTLLPGDVILTGTSSGIGPMEVGDRVTVCIEGIGSLTNTVGKR